MPARAARFQKARVELREGLRSICSADQRPKAIEDVEQARQGFVELAAECKDSPLLQQEALLGAAQAEESLIGVPTKDDPAKSRGSLERAVDLYRQIVKAYPKAISSTSLTSGLGNWSPILPPLKAFTQN